MKMFFLYFYLIFYLFILVFNVFCDVFWMNVIIFKYILGLDLYELYINQWIDECMYVINFDEDVFFYLKIGVCGMRVL